MIWTDSGTSWWIFEYEVSYTFKGDILKGLVEDSVRGGTELDKDMDMRLESDWGGVEDPIRRRWVNSSVDMTEDIELDKRVIKWGGWSYSSGEQSEEGTRTVVMVYCSSDGYRVENVDMEWVEDVGVIRWTVDSSGVVGELVYLVQCIGDSGNRSQKMWATDDSNSMALISIRYYSEGRYDSMDDILLVTRRSRTPVTHITPWGSLDRSKSYYQTLWSRSIDHYNNNAVRSLNYARCKGYLRAYAEYAAGHIMHHYLHVQEMTNVRYLCGSFYESGQGYMAARLKVDPGQNMDIAWGSRVRNDIRSGGMTKVHGTKEDINKRTIDAGGDRDVLKYMGVQHSRTILMMEQYQLRWVEEGCISGATTVLDGMFLLRGDRGHVLTKRGIERLDTRAVWMLRSDGEGAK
ncbi:hypothetical protein Tco_1041703 [Tanacetum coccineum]|uniref:Uncharacterized protein n=1 Tax=Tanacetum coccineum TaxID=301880 RepID=A0ABQ5GJJ2_9ASTR